MVSKERASEVLDYVEMHGKDAAREYFGLSKDSVRRYVHRAKSFHKSETGQKNLPKILFFDTETCPMNGWFFNLFKPHIDGAVQVEKNTQLICFTAKWMGKDEIINSCVTPDEILKGDDSRVSRNLWNLLDEADVAIAHNLVRFDRKIANYRFLVNGLKPTSPYKLIDTLQKVKEEFKFSSNRLDFINKVLGLERKRETGGMQLWIDCAHGDQEALDKMQYYCDGDILALEDVYYALAPWFRSNINFGVFTDGEKEMCSHCGSENVRLTDKKYVTGVSRFPTYKCDDCGGYSRARNSELTLQKRKNLLTSIAKG